jgi:hypothetical protein
MYPVPEKPFSLGELPGAATHLLLIPPGLHPFR